LNHDGTTSGGDGINKVYLRKGYGGACALGLKNGSA